MAHRPDIVERQVIELRIADATAGRRLLARLHAPLARIAATEVERALDQFPRTDDVVTLERLDVDLGRLPAETVEEAIGPALRAALVRALDVSLAQPRSAPDAGADDARTAAAAFGRFLDEGLLPAWSPAIGVSPADADAPYRTFALAANSDEERLAEVLRRRAKMPAALSRLAASLDGDARDRVAAWLGPGWTAATKMRVEAFERRLHRTAIGRVLGRERLHLALWRATFEALAAHQGARRPDALVGAIAERLRRTLKVGDAAGPRAVRDRGPLVARRWELRRRLRQLRRGPLHDLASSLARRVARLEDHEVDGALTACAHLERCVDAHGVVRPGAELIAASAALIGPFGRADGSASLDVALRRLRREFDDGPQPQPFPTGPERLHVEDAGLCLLAPWLATLFARLGVWDAEHGVMSTGARRHAVRMLAYVATGRPAVDEHLLGVAKVLAGLDPRAVPDPAEPLLEVEARELDAFIEAMAARLSPLGRLSTDGLRGSWLLRPGILGQRDGVWRVQIEQRPWDILLERLPWDRQWVVLPWLPAPLRVEWSA